MDDDPRLLALPIIALIKEFFDIKFLIIELLIEFEVVEFYAYYYILLTITNNNIK